MSCFDLIESMKIDFLAQTGCHATDIYVGDNEYKTIIIEGEIVFDLQEYEALCESSAVCGLRLHKVKDDTHLRLGLEI